jgi:hypothetical protein
MNANTDNISLDEKRFEELFDFALEVLLGKKSTAEIEIWLYANDVLSTLLANDDYLDLVSLDFSKERIQADVCSILERNIDTREVELAKVRDILMAAGWHPKNRSARNQLEVQGKTASEHADRIIAEFGDLKVGSTRGIVWAASDVCFGRIPKADTVRQPSPGPMAYIGSAHNAYMHIFVGCKGRLYCLADVTGDLYESGGFWDTLATLLLGLDRYGPALPGA